MCSTSKISLLLAAVMMTAGCGKKEDPAAAPPAPATEAKSLVCHEVELVMIDETTTPHTSVLEIEGDAPRLRLQRGGILGKAGDKFRFCEAQ